METRRRGAIRAEQDNLDLRCIDDEHDQDVAGARDFGRRGGGHRAEAYGGVLGGWPDIAGNGGNAEADETRHDGASHRAGADHADASGETPGGQAGLGRTYGWQSTSGVTAPSA